jgi:hypothetical protein
MLTAACTVARAQELSGMGGLMRPVGEDVQSYAWQFDFRYGLSRHWAWSASWLNEGHVPDHHRDGFVSQLWLRWPFSNDRFELDAGAGFDRYYDTQPGENGDSVNVHGFAPIYSLSVTDYTDSPWFVRLTFNRVNPSSDIRIDSVVLGVGYGLEHRVNSGTPAPAEAGRTTNNEFTVFVGQSVVNTLASENALAYSVEYRHGIGRHLDWTVSWIYEGDPEIVRRQGLGTQVWLVGAYLNDRLALGIGFGVYIYIDKKETEATDQDKNSDVAGLITPTIAYRLSDHWLARFNWDRIVSNYNKDADVFLLGLGYRW